MLRLEPFTKDRGRPAVITRSLASLRLPGFSTRRLARMSDSLVRVSRRVGWGARRPMHPLRGATVGTQGACGGGDQADGSIRGKPGLVPPTRPAAVHTPR